MTTPPPPPPGSGPGGSQPNDPMGGQPPSSPPPPGPPPSYGSGPGQPPQAPPPAPGGAPQGGGSNKGKTMSIISIVTGVLGICYAGCFIFGIAAVVLGVLGKKEAELIGDKSVRTMAIVGLVLGIVGIVLGIVSWILQASGVEIYTVDFETS